MEKENITPLSLGIDNFILWSKGWYICTDKNRPLLEIVKDILSLDDYPFCTSWTDIFLILTNKIDLYNKWLIKNDKSVNIIDFHRVFDELMTELMFKKYDEPYEYSVLKVFRHVFAWNVETNSKLIPPHYNKELRKKGYVLELKQGMTYKEMNKRVDYIFNDRK